MLTAGRRLGEWILEAPLGRGAFAEVWRARHNAFEDRVAAVKVPHDPALAEMLRREGKLLARVEGPHIVAVHGLDPEHDPPYLVMDLVPGGSLRARIEAGATPPHDALRLVRQVAQGLEAAHRHGVVHRDLKPENVLLDAAGAAHVADFGLGLVTARVTDALLESGSLRSRDGHDLVGTLRYMAPEQRDSGATTGARPAAEGSEERAPTPAERKSIDGRADLFALGVVLFELLTGEAPNPGEVPSDVVPGLDHRLDRLYRNLVARLPSRCASATALLAELDLLLAGGGVAEPTVDPIALAAARSVEVPAGPLPWRLAAAAIDALPILLLALGPLGGSRRPLLLLAWVAWDLAINVATARTPGKRALGLRVARQDGGEPDLTQRFLRAAVRLPATALLGLGHLPALLREDKRALHDLVADTQVVHDLRGGAGSR